MSKHPEDEFEHLPPYAAAVKRVEKSRDLLSTSVGVVVQPPPLLVHLSEKETSHPERRLKGDERAGLGSILGWDSRSSRGKPLTGIKGFTRQQGISMLFSKHVPIIESPSTERPSELSISSAATEDTVVPKPKAKQPKMRRCGQAQFITYRYYARDKTMDKPLGAAIMDFCRTASMGCHTSGCAFKRGEHERRWIHSSVRITATIKEESISNADGRITVWSSCKQCGTLSHKGDLSDGAW
jgi:1-phosphatidylinositol-3-phosphate 5-kinase